MIKAIVRSCAVAALILSTASFAAAPDNMLVKNNSMYTSDAYVHNVAGQSLPAGQSQLVPWTAVTNLCHGVNPPFAQAQDPCSFEVFATVDPTNNPKQIDVGTVTFNVNDGKVVNIQVTTDAKSRHLTIKTMFPGEFELDES